jgi:F0F1-type ATP synthase assembly protein I
MGTDDERKRKIEEIGRTVRNSGLAYGAGITLVGSVVVMLGVGWAVDAYFDSSPAGTIGGIIIGAVVGFYQFFKITARIFKD